MWAPLIAAGISAAGSLAGGAMSSAGSSAANNATMQFNSQEAKANRDWQERMSNTAYQRAMADMRAAGLNPILAYQQGGAGTPPGGQASAKLDNAMEGMGHGVSSAAQAGQKAIDMKNTMAQTEATTTQADLNQANSMLAAANREKSLAEATQSASQTQKNNAETAYTVEQMKNPEEYRKLMSAQAHSARSQGDLNYRQLEDNKAFGSSATGQNVGSFKRMSDSFMGWFKEHMKNYNPTNPGSSPAGPGGDLVIDMKK
ncbi:DNA pilot protein [Blackfly microvirus SF02]|uniref:DNA pilot protein n=1 Tax=Blackfly microvirus SF02 TaxID=2576452 RepID=A0A4P8PKI0_9VIRU|nr:DNA pilot protein [Blackfly microvirus SF02]